MSEKKATKGLGGESKAYLYNLRTCFGKNRQHFPPPPHETSKLTKSLEFPAAALAAAAELLSILVRRETDETV